MRYAQLFSEGGLRQTKGLACSFHIHMDAYMRISIAGQESLCGNALAAAPRTFYRRDVPNDLSLRIRKARRGLDMNQADFAKALGVNQSTVSRWESGATPDVADIAKIAALTGLDIETLANADLNASQRGPSLFVKGEVAAGVWKEAMEWERSDWVPYQGGSHIDAPVSARFGLVVAGESMNEVYPPGTILDCVSCLHAGIEEIRSGQRVIVTRKRVDGEVEATVKEYQETEEGVWLVPKSRNPAFQQPIPLTADDPDIEETRIVAIVRGSYRPEP